MKKLVISLIVAFVFPHLVFARYNPLERQNNKFGIHTVDVNDIRDLPALVNSSGGDWGYVTLVIGETDRDKEKWQRVFDQMRRLHLIPIVRLATKLDGASWVKPRKEDLDSWVTFLAGLNWPIENRYVVLFNEPNHAKEWGNAINPEEYADFAIDISNRLKQSSDDFFILPAGLDASAGNTGESLDEVAFLQRMVRAKPEFFSAIDGWTSHSYPNPGFSAPVGNRGRGSLMTYQWEVEVLRKLGLLSNLPIFITETGWVHSDGLSFNSLYLTPEQISENLRIAAREIWNDPGIVAVTPFLFNYQGVPFDHFSWKKLGSDEFYAHYYAYQSIVKSKGQPRQKERYSFSKPFIPEKLVAGSRYALMGTLKNSGQGIFDSRDNYSLSLDNSKRQFITFIDPLPVIEPNEEGDVTIHVETPKAPGTYHLSLGLRHNQETQTLEEKNVNLVPPPSLRLHIKLAWRRKNHTSDATVLVYKGDELLQKFTNVIFNDGEAIAEGLTNIIPEETYRVVVLVPYYLPRQIAAKLSASQTEISFKRLLPFDFDMDGKFSVIDLFALFSLKPHAVLGLFLGA